MATKKLSEGVGKKIVEALKKQSEIEINAIPNEPVEDSVNNLENDVLSDDLSQVFNEDIDIHEALNEDDLLDNIHPEDYFSSSPEVNDNQGAPAVKPFANYQASSVGLSDSIMQDLDTFEIPSNIAVLKKLITQLPSGVTRHTGAQIIKQTMEALGISMKSVLQEAQQVQEGLNNSVKECHSSVQEYKKQIVLLEKQAQNYQKQYSALNELISLFIQTGL